MINERNPRFAFLPAVLRIMSIFEEEQEADEPILPQRRAARLEHDTGSCHFVWSDHPAQKSAPSPPPKIPEKKTTLAKMPI